MNVDGDNSTTDPAEFLKKYSGYTFNRGIYRIHDVNDIPKWTGIVEDNISNLELTDMEVYWGIMGQMMP